MNLRKSQTNLSSKPDGRCLCLCSVFVLSLLSLSSLSLSLLSKTNLSSKPDWKTRHPVTEERTAPVRANPGSTRVLRKILQKRIFSLYMQTCLNIWSDQPWSGGDRATRRRLRQRRPRKSWALPSLPIRFQRCALPSCYSVSEQECLTWEGPCLGQAELPARRQPPLQILPAGGHADELEGGLAGGIAGGLAGGHLDVQGDLQGESCECSPCLNLAFLL